MKIVDCDYFVVGSGMAGLMSALHLAAYGKVVVATKGRLQDCNTNFALGGFYLLGVLVILLARTCFLHKDTER